MDKCEWGKDDYSLEIKSLPPAPMATTTVSDNGETQTINSRKARKGKAGKQPMLFSEQE